MGVVDSVYKYEDQLGSQWDLKIHSLTGTENKLKFKVETTSLPQPSINVERKQSGELVFKSYTDIDDFSVTLRESPDFSTYQFFEDWLDEFYDRDKRVFKTFDSLVSYQKYLYNVQVSFYYGGVTAFADSETDYYFYAENCKPTGIDGVTLDYTGQPLLFTVHFKPEKISLQEL